MKAMNIHPPVIVFLTNLIFDATLLFMVGVNSSVELELEVELEVVVEVESSPCIFSPCNSAIISLITFIIVDREYAPMNARSGYTGYKNLSS